MLETYADQDFDTSSGQRMLQGDIVAGALCRRDVCAVVSGVLSVPTIADIDTTEDSPDNQTATYSTYLRATNQQLIPWLLNYRIPVGADVITWITLRIHKAGIIQRSPLDTYTKQEILALISQAIATALGAGGVIDKGTTTMLGGVAAISSTHVTPTSNIQLTGQDSGVNGTLSVLSRVPGSGAIIKSSNGADAGTIGWVIFADDDSIASFATAGIAPGGAGNPIDGTFLTLGSEVFVWVNVVVNPTDVQIGANTAASYQNMVDVININTVTALCNAIMDGASISLTANIAGAGGNSTVLTISDPTYGIITPFSGGN